MWGLQLVEVKIKICMFMFMFLDLGRDGLFLGVSIEQCGSLKGNDKETCCKTL